MLSRDSSSPVITEPLAANGNRVLLQDRVVAIDSMMSAFDPHDPRSAPLFGEYKRKVAALVGEVCALEQ